MPVSACDFFYHHSELETITAINNLKAHTDGEEGEGGNFRYSDWSLPSTSREPRQGKRVTTDRTRSQSFLPSPCPCSHNLSGEHPPPVPRPLASSHKTQRVTRRCAPKHPKTSTSAGSDLQRITRLVRKNHRTPRQHFQEHLAGALGNPLSSPLTSSSSPCSAPKVTEPTPSSRGLGARFPTGAGKIPGQVRPPRSRQPRCMPFTFPRSEGRQPTSPCSAVRLRAGRGVMESGELFSDNQRWEAAPVNSVHPVAAGSVSSSWQQPSQEQWWAQLEIFHN